MTLARTQPNARIPVILDTDIGTDIDDTWALAFLLRCPELDVRLITTTTGDTHARARIVARLLEIAGRTDIPIGIGVPLESAPIYQSAWVDGYDLGRYPGRIVPNGIAAIVDVIGESPTPVTVLGIGPLPNLAAALMHAPGLVRNARLVGMFGSLRLGYFGSAEIPAEYNVRLYPHACRNVFAAQWEVTVSPLDTCGAVQLRGEKYQAVRGSADPLLRAVMENYACWTAANQNPLYNGFNPEVESSILFDLVPIYLAFSEALVEIETLDLCVSADGFTRIAEGGSQVRCATRWRDLGAFEDLIVARLLGN